MSNDLSGFASNATKTRANVTSGLRSVRSASDAGLWHGWKAPPHANHDNRFTPATNPKYDKAGLLAKHVAGDCCPPELLARGRMAACRRGTRARSRALFLPSSSPSHRLSSVDHLQNNGRGHEASWPPGLDQAGRVQGMDMACIQVTRLSRHGGIASPLSNEYAVQLVNKHAQPVTYELFQLQVEWEQGSRQRVLGACPGYRTTDYCA